MSTKTSASPKAGKPGSTHAIPPIDMHSACSETGSMAGTIQIRNVPEDVHRRLKSKAALEGLSLSDYMLREAIRLASYPTMGEIRARLSALPKYDLSPEVIVEAVREGRDER